MPAPFHDKPRRRVLLLLPARARLDTVDAIRGDARRPRQGLLRDGRQLREGHARHRRDRGGDAHARLTVQVSTKLNRSHIVTGRRALILPTLGRTEMDVQATGPQRVSVEDSMSMVHESQGSLQPASPAPPQRGRDRHGHRRAGARRTAPTPRRPTGAACRRLPAHPHAHRARGPGLRRLRGEARHARRLRAAARRRATTGTSRPTPARRRAKFTVNELEYPKVPEGRLMLQTLRSHDQYNTTIYGKDDRYRGIHGGRKVVLVHAEGPRGARPRRGRPRRPRVRSATDGTERRAEGWRAVAYNTPARHTRRPTTRRRTCSCRSTPSANDEQHPGRRRPHHPPRARRRPRPRLTRPREGALAGRSFSRTKSPFVLRVNVLLKCSGGHQGRGRTCATGVPGGDAARAARRRARRPRRGRGACSGASPAAGSSRPRMRAAHGTSEVPPRQPGSATAAGAVDSGASGARP